MSKDSVNVFAVITIEGFGDYHIAEPTFEVYAVAVRKMIGKGEPDLVSAGKVVFDSCYLNNNGALVDIQKNRTLYSSICFHTASAVEVLDGELKKN